MTASRPGIPSITTRALGVAWLLLGAQVAAGDRLHGLRSPVAATGAGRGA